MIPTNGSSADSAGRGAILFHIVVDDFARSYSLDGPEANAMRLHLEVQKAARNHSRKLREIGLRADSKDEALATMREHFLEYVFSGAWKS